MGFEWQDSGVKKMMFRLESFCAISLVFQNPKIPCAVGRSTYSQGIWKGLTLMIHPMRLPNSSGT